MYITSNDIRQSRISSLDFLLTLSNTLLDTGARLSGLCLQGNRQMLEWSGAFLDALEPGQDDQTREAKIDDIVGSACRTSAENLESFYRAIEEGYKGVLTAIDTHIQSADGLLLETIDRSKRLSPWEGEVALDTVRAAVESAEVALHGFTESAIQTCEMVEGPVTQAVVTMNPGMQKKKAAPRKRAVASEQ